MSIIGKKLKLYREEKGLNIKTIAENVGFTSTYLSFIENERRNPTEENTKKILTKGFRMKSKEADALYNEWRLAELSEEAKRLGGVIDQELCIAVDLFQPRNGKLVRSGQMAFDKSFASKGKKYFAIQAKESALNGLVEADNYLLIEETKAINDKQAVFFRLKQVFGVGYLYKDGKFIEIRGSHKKWQPISEKDSALEILGVLKAVTHLNP